MASEADLIQNFIDSSDASIYLKDEEGRLLMANRQVAEMLKVSKEELIGKTVYDIFSKEDADKLWANDRKVIETRTTVTFKASISFPSGKITVIDHKFPVPVEGHSNAVGGIAIDITKME